MRKLLRPFSAAIFSPLLCLFLLSLNGLQMVSMVVVLFSPTAFREINRRLSALFYRSLCLLLEKVLGVEFILTGDKLPWKENAFLIANHQSMCDIPALLPVAVLAGRAGDLKWFVKYPLKWVPGVGWGLQFLDCLFMKRNWNADRENVLATFERLRRNGSPFWVISFLEGTRATPLKLARSREFERKAGLPELRYVMSPRTKGFTATLEGLNELNQAVYDATIAYEGFPHGRIPGLGSLFFGPMQKVHVHMRRFPIAGIPAGTEERARWIQERFREKDELMAAFYRDGRFASGDLASLRGR
jgi:1-acyl-sn-glycerol-3-phosphate acyltransferase